MIPFAPDSGWFARHWYDNAAREPVPRATLAGGALWRAAVAVTAALVTAGRAI